MKDDRKTRIILIAAAVLLALLLIASSVWASHRANERRDRLEQTQSAQSVHADRQAEADRMAKPDGQRSHNGADHDRPGMEVGDKPEDVCGELAPKALERFIAGANLDDLFTRDADGIEWAGRSSVQTLPADQWAGFLNTTQDDETVCSVWTGEESPWMLKYRHTGDKGWLVDWVNGPGMGMKGLQDGKPDPVPEQNGEATVE